MTLNRIAILILLSLSAILPAKERVPGTKIAIDPPNGFVPAKQFTGYLMKETGASILVNSLSGAPFAEVSGGFATEGMARQGMKLLSKKKLKVGNFDGVLLHASQEVQGSVFLKWLLAFGDHSETNLIVATFPGALEDQLSEKLKASVLTAEWQKSLQLDFFDGLTFTVSESGALKFANKMGNNVILTKGGEFPQKDAGAPVVIVGASATENWQIPADKRVFSIARLKQTAMIESPKVIEGKDFKIDGLDGYFVSAEGKDKETGEPIAMEQCLLLTADGYYLFQALVGKDQKEQFAADFRKILQSFKRK